MKLTFLGAARTVTGSRILFEHNHFKGLIDCGLFQGPKNLRQMNWMEQPEMKDAQCVILTHAHVDHSGYLPRLYKNGFRGAIYCSKSTADLLPVMLLDAAKLQEEDARFANRSKYSHHDPALPLYETSDAEGCKDLLHPTPWLEWRNLTPSLSLRFIRAGHILGSACIQLAFTNDQTTRVVTFTGDVGSSHSKIIRDPEKIFDTDFLIVESTYGNRTLNREHVSADLADVINRVFSRGGTLVIPAFSVGRTQDLLQLIFELKKGGKIKNVPVYVDSPMSHKVTSLYLKHFDELKDDASDTTLKDSLEHVAFHPVLSPDESMLLCMSDEPKIVISASGMLQGGRVLHHLKAKLPKAENGVLFVGFQSAGTKGRLLKEGIPSLRIHHQEISVECEIFSIEGLSAHADSNELMNWISSIQTPPRMTFVNHGELEASLSFAERIRRELHWKDVIVPEIGQTFNLSEQISKRRES